MYIYNNSIQKKKKKIYVQTSAHLLYTVTNLIPGYGNLNI